MGSQTHMDSINSSYSFLLLFAPGQPGPSVQEQAPMCHEAEKGQIQDRTEYNGGLTD